MEPQVDKSKVDVTVYEINENTQFCSYTATWCGPCKRIKPKVIEKTLFKSFFNEFVPFFVINKNDELIDSIQTSDELLLKQFLSKNGINVMILDEDF